MNYKDAMQAWLDNHNVKLDMYYDGKWVEIVHNNNKLTPVFYMDQEYRLRPVKHKIRIAKLATVYEEGGSSHWHVTVKPEDYTAISNHPRFLQWVTEEMEVE